MIGTESAKRGKKAKRSKDVDYSDQDDSADEFEKPEKKKKEKRGKATSATTRSGRRASSGPFVIASFGKRCILATHTQFFLRLETLAGEADNGNHVVMAAPILEEITGQALNMAGTGVFSPTVFDSLRSHLLSRMQLVNTSPKTR